ARGAARYARAVATQRWPGRKHRPGARGSVTRSVTSRRRWPRVHCLRGRGHARHSPPPALRPRPCDRGDPYARLLEAGGGEPPGPRPGARDLSGPLPHRSAAGRHASGRAGHHRREAGGAHEVVEFLEITGKDLLEEDDLAVETLCEVVQHVV